jgi:transcriptional regulator with GAF, ATPase, and Fis domain
MADTKGSMELARSFAETSRVLLGQSTLEQTLEAVAERAPASVRGADWACVSIITREGTVETPAFSDVQAAQHAPRLRPVLELGEGPVRLAAADGSVLRIDDTAEEERWPAFARRAKELGVGSIIACGLRAGPGLRAALVLQSAKAGVFDGQAADAADVYAVHASSAIARSQTADSLRSAVGTRQVIGEATGILMERHRIESQTAFGLLVRSSQNLNVKLRVVAEHVVRTGQDPYTLRPGDLRAGE